MNKCRECKIELTDNYDINGRCGPCNYKITKSTFGLWGAGTQFGPPSKETLFDVRDRYLKGTRNGYEIIHVREVEND